MENKELVLEELENVSGGAKRVGTVLIVGCEHRCNCRKGPGSDYSKWGYAYAGKVYDFYGWNGHWALIKADGNLKYVYRDFIQVL